MPPISIAAFRNASQGEALKYIARHPEKPMIRRRRQKGRRRRRTKAPREL
jgi:hypothetical protein